MQVAANGLVHRRVARGFRVIHVDNRDAGLSRGFESNGTPSLAWAMLRFLLRLAASVRRAWRPGGVVRQLIAVAADGDCTPRLARIGTPTHIIHGADDPLVPVAAAHDLHAGIAASTLEIIDGMGHDLPAPLWPRLLDAIGRA